MTAEERIAYYENAIRKHRDSWLAGDDKCWKDNEELYKILPEGYSPPIRDTTVELNLCEKYIKSCHAPHITYISPQRRIEELEAEVARLETEIAAYREWEYKYG